MLWHKVFLVEKYRFLDEKQDAESKDRYNFLPNELSRGKPSGGSLYVNVNKLLEAMFLDVWLDVNFVRWKTLWLDWI